MDKEKALTYWLYRREKARELRGLEAGVLCYLH